jgi:hypothetical protein
VSGFQIWLVHTLRAHNVAHAVMTSWWGWPTAESIHFIGLSLLVGCIGAFDLRLLGIGKRIPIAALHRLIRWGLLGFAINVVSGLAFLATEPEQYVYNPSFHFKVLFLAIAGVNAVTFYVVPYRRATRPGVVDAPRSAKVIAAVSLCMWMSVIVAGRMLTFFRPIPCGRSSPGFLATCVPPERRASTRLEPHDRKRVTSISSPSA